MTAPELTHLAVAHPDRAWIAEVRDALDGWAAAAAVTPTSSVLGGGAIAVAEAAFSEMHDGRPALLLPSATYALRVGLQVLGVRPGDEVICPVIDWPAGYAAVASLGATPVPVAVSPDTLTLDPAASAAARTPLTRAALACHLHGICADLPALRRQLPGVRILEDAAQAFGSRLDGRLAGTMGDAAVLSLGPEKQIDAGEGGVLLCDRRTRHDKAIAIACHPLRQLLSGVASATPAFAVRPHPMTAVLALHRLAVWQAAAARSRYEEMARLLSAGGSVRPLGAAARHASCQPCVPVLLDGEAATPPAGVRWSKSGAQVLPGLDPAAHQVAARLLARVRLAACEPA